MAATNDSSLRKRAAAAAATLLGMVPGAQAAKPSPVESVPAADRWTWDTSYMQYSEAERISVSEPQVGVRRDFAEHRSLSILATVDVISGATPLGTLPATPNTSPNTVTGPSGRAVNPDVGKVPTGHMTDTRVGLNMAYERPRGSSSSEIIGGNISKEHDFLSLGGSYTYNKDFNQKATTLSIGVSPEYDVVSPNGGLPYAYATKDAPGEFEGHNKAKYLVSGLVGITQVINRRTLMQWNYAPTYENGYLNDPYKLISLINTQGDPLSAIHEKRPGSRLQHSIYWLTRYNFVGRDVFSLGLRYFVDNWGIHSQTLDFTYRWQYHDRRYLEPHVRYYHQTQADFSYIGLYNGYPMPAYASADYRLQAIDGITFGVRTGWKMQNESELILRAEYYMQTGDDMPSQAVGLQKAYNLFPTLYATILQVEYVFEPSKLWSKKNPT